MCFGRSWRTELDSRLGPCPADRPAGGGAAPGRDRLVGEVFPLGLACLELPIVLSGFVPLQGRVETIQGQWDLGQGFCPTFLRGLPSPPYLLGFRDLT